MTQSIIEYSAYEFIRITNPELQETWNMVSDIIQVRDAIARNQALYKAFNIKLDILELYMRSYQRVLENSTVYGSNYKDLEATKLREEHKKLQSKFNRYMKIAKQSIDNLDK